MQISTQNFTNTYTSTKTMDNLKEKYGDNFDNYMKIFEEFSNDKVISEDELLSLRAEEMKAITEITDVQNANGANIKAEAKFYGLFSNYPDEIAQKLEDLEKKHIETKDGKYKLMQSEIKLQALNYQTGGNIDSIFVVDNNGNFTWEDKELNIDLKSMNVESFLTSMVDVFTKKYETTKDSELKDRYKDLVDNYLDMKKDFKENSSFKNISFYG